MWWLSSWVWSKERRWSGAFGPRVRVASWASGTSTAFPMWLAIPRATK